MPDNRLAKTRRSLPEGYQFGDADYEPPTVGVSYRRACGCHGERDETDLSTAHFTCRRHRRAAEQWWKAVMMFTPKPELVAPWRRPSDNAAERLKRQSGFTANVIEGDHFDTDCDPGDENEPRPRRLRRREA